LVQVYDLAALADSNSVLIQQHLQNISDFQKLVIVSRLAKIVVGA